jgi:hypothetical protein
MSIEVTISSVRRVASTQARAALRALAPSSTLLGAAPALAEGGPPAPAEELEQAKPGEQSGSRANVSVYGRAQMIVGIDPQNEGDVPDTSVAPDGASKKEWNASVQMNSALGGRFTYPRPIGGFTASGQVLVVQYVRRVFLISTAGFTLEHPEAGVKIGIGRFVQPTVNTLSPGVFQFSTSWGNLIHATTGAYIARSFDRLVVQGGVGRPDFVLTSGPITASPRAAPRMPFVEGRVAYVDPDIAGELPSGAAVGPRRGALTLGVSVAYGKQRVGVGEKAAVMAASPGAVDPLIEDVSSWLLSAEAILPLGALVLAGEWYIGRGANAYIGAVRQRPVVDPMTGRHTALMSRGGWVQLSYALPRRWIAVALGGLEHVTGGLGDGVPVDGARKISVNRLLTLSLSKNFDFGMHAGVQVQQQSTRYVEHSDGAMYSVLLESSIDF